MSSDDNHWLVSFLLHTWESMKVSQTATAAAAAEAEKTKTITTKTTILRSNGSLCVPPDPFRRPNPPLGIYIYVYIYIYMNICYISCMLFPYFENRNRIYEERKQIKQSNEKGRWKGTAAEGRRQRREKEDAQTWEKQRRNKIKYQMEMRDEGAAAEESKKES